MEKEEKNNCSNNDSNKGVFNESQNFLENKHSKNKNFCCNQMNYNKNEMNRCQANFHEINANFAYAPKIGLKNIGATCYMNTTLQCFCHIEKFVNFFKYSKNVISMVRNNKNNLIYLWLEAIKII